MADLECQQMWDELKLGYTEAWGSPILRSEIFNVFYSGASSLGRDQIRCFAGAEEAIYAFFRALVQPGDEVIIFTPAYQSLISVAKAQGAKVICIDLEIDQGCSEGEAPRWRFNVEKVRAAVKPSKTKCVVLNCPHNPTGAMLTLEEQRSIVEICEESNLYLFSDEVYRCMELDESHRLPPACTLYRKAVSLGVLSKASGLAGLRIGWIATSDQDILKTVADYKHYLSICNSAPSEVLALVALRNWSSIVSRNREIASANLGLMMQTLLAKHSPRLLEWVAPRGGCVGFMRWVGPGKLEKVAEDMLERGILLLPGAYFPGTEHDAEHGATDNTTETKETPTLTPHLDFTQYFRFGFGRSSFESGLRAFDAALDDMFGGGV